MWHKEDQRKAAEIGSGSQLSQERNTGNGRLFLKSLGLALSVTPTANAAAGHLRLSICNHCETVAALDARSAGIKRLAIANTCMVWHYESDKRLSTNYGYQPEAGQEKEDSNTRSARKTLSSQTSVQYWEYS